jgi:hypothetical protein
MIILFFGLSISKMFNVLRLITYMDDNEVIQDSLFSVKKTGQFLANA